MIAWLRGTLRARGEGGKLIVDVGGVGYAVLVPVGVAADVALGETVELHIHTHVREDQLNLFGFEDELSLETFLVLNGVSKVGPKLALNVLSGIGAAQLVDAVETQDLARLTSISGVGKRLAERLAVELKGKLPDAHGGTASPTTPRGPASREPSTFRDLRSALANLEYRPKEVDAVTQALRQSQPEAPFDELLREALRVLRK